MPVVANVDGRFYPTGPDAPARMVDILARQVASPVQFVAGLRTLYDAGARVFVEVGPKKALHGFVQDVLGGNHDTDHDEVVALFTNHPKQGDVVSFNQALCGLYAAGHGAPAPVATPAPVTTPAPAVSVAPPAAAPAVEDDRYAQLGHLLADFLERSQEVYSGAAPRPRPAATEPVVITGASLGLPGTDRVFDDANVGHILAGRQLIDSIPLPFREAMADKHITRLVKSEQGAPRFDTIDSAADVIKLAGRAGEFDVVGEFGVDEERDKALDDCTRLAIGAGIDALRDAGIPLVHHYRSTTVGTRLATRWGLPDALRDDTGVIFASAFPGYAEFAVELERYLADRFRRAELARLRTLRSDVDGGAVALDRRIAELEAEIDAAPFTFDRRFLFRVLSMGHAQFAEIIGARGPNTQVNAACASTTQAINLAEDWIRAGRCRRVVIVAADNVTADPLLPWVGAGFLASGAAATDEAVDEAALPFDNRRHGMLLGMGAAGIVVESADAARERGLRPICEVLAGVTANSAFHGTRLDVEHVTAVMAGLVARAERRGVDRHAIAGETVFVSHETYTPARGGSAQAEIDALRSVFGADADRVIIANTKGFTGHPMGVGIEDVVAVKALETGIVPPVPNFKEVDPSLGSLNLSTGGSYPVRYALRLAAGFGSQISMVLLRWTPVPDGRHRTPDELGYEYRIVDRAAWRRWLGAVTGSADARLEVDHRRLRVAETAVPAPAPAPAPVVEQVVAAPPPADTVADDVLAVVADKTGYPTDVLEPDLDLEADLGIDTVKQAEVFAQIREHFTIPRDDTLKLRDYPTLAHVITYVRERTDTATPPPTDTTDTITDDSTRRRRRQDRLPHRRPRTRPRPRSRPRHRHRQTGRSLRPNPRTLHHPPRRHPQTPRLPHPRPRHHLRPRTNRHPHPTTHRHHRHHHRRRTRRRRRQDRLPHRRPRTRPRPRSRPRHRHRQTSRSLRPNPRTLHHPPRRHPQTPRLPHPRPRHHLRPRTGRHRRNHGARGGARRAHARAGRHLPPPRPGGDHPPAARHVRGDRRRARRRHPGRGRPRQGRRRRGARRPARRAGRRGAGAGPR